MKIIRMFFIVFILSITSAYIGAKSINPEKLEKRIIYRPINKTYDLIPEIRSKAQEKFFFTKDGIRIDYMRINGHEHKNRPVIIFCHGNSGNMTRYGNQNKLKFLVNKGYEVFTFDYRGFGQSGGEVDEKGIYSDLTSLIYHLNQKYLIQKNEIVLYGHSLGSAVVIDAASKMKLKGVIVEGAFTSIEDVKRYKLDEEDNIRSIFLAMRDCYYKAIPITQKFSSKDKIARIKSPTLIIHAVNDDIIPYQMGEKLAKLKPDAQTYFSKTGGHCDWGWQDRYILRFLSNLR